MSRPAPPVVDFYSRHPISEAQIVAALRRGGKDLERLAPEDLYDFDQDHYGGLEAVEALGRRAGIDAASRVLDVCAGLAGPARFMGMNAVATAPRLRVPVLYLAAEGDDNAGYDFSDEGVAAGNAEAKEWGLSNAKFVKKDVAGFAAQEKKRTSSSRARRNESMTSCSAISVFVEFTTGGQVA